MQTCTHVVSSGVCGREAVPGTDRCTHHGGNSAAKTLESKGIAAYRLNRFQARFNELSTDQNVKDLRGEIGILRMMIEDKLNRCKDDYDLMLQSSSIASLVSNVNTLVTSCHRIETLTGQVLDKQSIAEFAQQVIGIISEICSPEQSDIVAGRILDLLSKKKE